MAFIDHLNWTRLPPKAVFKAIQAFVAVFFAAMPVMTAPV